MGHEGEAADVSQVAFQRTKFGCKVATTAGEGVPFTSDDITAVEDAQQGENQATIAIVRHSTSIIALASQVAQRIQRNVVILIHKQLHKTMARVRTEGGAAKRRER